MPFARTIYNSDFSIDFDLNNERISCKDLLKGE